MYCPSCGKPIETDNHFCPHCGHANPLATEGAALQPPPPSPPQTTPDTTIYAGFWKRAAALLLDTVITMVMSFIVGFFFGLMAAFSSLEEGTAEAFSSLLGVMVSWLYFAWMESSPRQATFGKALIGIKVTDLEGGRISFGRATGRYFGKILSGLTLCIGYMMAGFTLRKQALHDKLAGTLVTLNDATPEAIQAAPPAPRSVPGLVTAVVFGLLFVPLIGILAAVGIPAYQDYMARASMEKVFAYSGNATGAVVQHYQRFNTLPSRIEETGVTLPDIPEVRSVTVNPNNGVVALSLGFPPVEDKVLLFIPSDHNGVIHWECRSNDIPARLLPKQCR